jgi:hypothetical protein
MDVSMYINFKNMDNPGPQGKHKAASITVLPAQVSLTK